MTSTIPRFDDIELPTTELEEWRYSRIGDIDFSSYEFATDGGEPSASVAALVDELGTPNSSVALRNGVLVNPPRVGTGVTISRPERLIGEPVDAFGGFIRASALDPVEVTIHSGAHIEEPIVIAVEVSGSNRGTACLLQLRAQEASSSRVVLLIGGASSDSLLLNDLLIDVEQAATLSLAVIQVLEDSTHLIGSVAATMARDASLTTTYVGIGGDYARVRFDTDLNGRGADAQIDSIYLGLGTQMHDLRTFQRHNDRDSSSRLDFRGAVGGSAHAVYTGLIRVGEQARGTNASQSNRIIKLSDQAWAESVPNLEIHNNDVRCAHASAIGPIDADQRFYLESRGVEPSQAEQLVVAGHFRDVLDHSAASQLATILKGDIADRLARSAVSDASAEQVQP